MSREKQMWFWVGGLAVFLGLVYLLSSVLTPFIAGLAVAYFLDPLADKLEAALKSRSAATALILLVFFVVVGAVGVALFPLLQAQVAGLVARIPDGVQAAHELLDPLVAQIEAELGAQEIQNLKDNAGAFAGKAVSWGLDVVQSLFMGGKAVMNTLSLLFIMPIVAFFLLRDWDILVAKVDSLLPRSSQETIREQFRDIDATIAGFVRGQATVCLALGTIYATGLTLVGLEFGLLIGLGTGLMAFVPYVGMVIGLLVAFGVAMLQFTEVTQFVMVAAVFGVGQTIDAAFLTPNLVGGRVGLHPVWIIFALMAGGALFGFTGVLLAVPVASVIGVLVRFGIGRYRASVLYTG
ncbi:AI-2E family transporter [Magnetovibrio sp. PR-2]|uniref:AI-2E family transporter n=1 Tax=Magnetovibrio sp. PR-2 TaxID=3120356 RepID=UPI002FCE3373